jgi:heme oxygenase (mycobilin-producing)
MTIIRINAITVPADAGDELAHRFAARAGAVDGQDGFEGFELLKPTDDRTTWLVVTRWRDEDAFEAWLSSPAFAQGHAGTSGAPAGSGHPGGEGGHPGGHPGATGGHPGGQAPVGVSSEVWAYVPVVTSTPNG